MKLPIASVCLAVCFAPLLISALSLQDEKVPAFSFAAVNYFHRYTKSEQHEYTPAGQANLNAWSDMVTINLYRQAQDGDALAAMANAVLANYKANKGSVLKTASLPRTKTKPAEHLIIVVFRRPEFVEAAFARFRMYEGVGSAVIYSHRVYGKKAGEEMNAWLAQNAPSIEKNLMTWNALPKLPTPQ